MRVFHAFTRNGIDMVDLTFNSTKMIQVLFIGDDGELLTSKAFISKIIRTKSYRENPKQGSESITNPGKITVTFKLSGKPEKANQ